MRVYKVLRKANGKLRSFCTYDRCAALTYEVGEVIKPKISGSKLFAFRSKEAALNFARDVGKVYLAEAKISNSKYIPYGTNFVSNKSDYFRVWNEKHWLVPKDQTDWWPKDTVFCDEITLIEEVS